MYCTKTIFKKRSGRNDNSSFVRIVAEARTKTILGVHLTGGHVSELVACATGRIEMDINAEQLGGNGISTPHTQQNNYGCGACAMRSRHSYISFPCT
ncbi:MAG: hypothetical protein ACN4GW_16165 [Desulforhopalus sp.]